MFFWISYIISLKLLLVQVDCLVAFLLWIHPYGIRLFLCLDLLFLLFVLLSLFLWDRHSVHLCMKQINLKLTEKQLEDLEKLSNAMGNVSKSNLIRIANNWIYNEIKRSYLNIKLNSNKKIVWKYAFKKFMKILVVVLRGV